jgi:HK97 gp10 family phage protein
MKAGRAGRVVQFEGLEEAREAIAALPDNVAAVLTAYIREGAALIESEAKRRVPKRERALERSINTTFSRGGLRATIGSELLYARFVELGTKRSKRKRYLYPAFMAGARLVRRRLRGTVADLGKARFRKYRHKSLKK